MNHNESLNNNSTNNNINNNTDNNSNNSVNNNNINNNKDNDYIIKKIRELLEFYLSDSNIRKDKYILNLISLDKEGWIDLSKLLQFKKIQNILNENSISNLDNQQLDLIFKDNKILTLSQDKTRIKRVQLFNQELSKQEIKEIDERTIYIEPITNDLSTNELIESLLLNDKSIFKNNSINNSNNNNNDCTNSDSSNNSLSIINHISIPKFPDRTIKGFSFIEFSTKEFAEIMITQIDQYPEKYNSLIAISKNEWLEKKKQFTYLSNRSRYLKINNVPIYYKNYTNDNNINNSYSKSNNNNNNSNSNSNKIEIKNKDQQTDINMDNSSDNQDDEIKIIDNQPKPIFMNKPILWKFFDNDTNISVSFLDYKAGRSEAILKFSTLSDLQYAIDQFQQGEIKMYNNVLHITGMDEKELNSLKERVSSHEVSKLKSSNPNYKPKHNYNNNNNNKNNNNYNKRKREQFK